MNLFFWKKKIPAEHKFKLVPKMKKYWIMECFVTLQLKTEATTPPKELRSIACPQPSSDYVDLFTGRRALHPYYLGVPSPCVTLGYYEASGTDTGAIGEETTHYKFYDFDENDAETIHLVPKEEVRFIKISPWRRYKEVELEINEIVPINPAS